MQTVNRLIAQFVPEHYDISLILDRKARVFQGIVTIHGSVPVISDTIRLHAKGLSITSVTFDGKAASLTTDTNDELVIAHPDITVGKHIITIGFDGKITDSLYGLYPCYYQHKGQKKELLMTQLESHHAREVFPCVDEPEAKATFDVTLTTEKGITVLGNMPLKQQTEDTDRLVTAFERTPRMSTYLVAFVVGELHKKSALTKSGVAVNVWATPAQPASHLDYALDLGVRIIEFFDSYFETPYPLPKADLVAVPDFAAGAMENWGLITFREIALLTDPEKSAVASQQYVAIVIAHELSHQWFGNLVTMEWWDDLWLNESFASIMEYVAVDAIEPGWNIWNDFSTSESIHALRRDSIDGVQPVQVAVGHPDEINTLFDPSIVYAKGARLIRMLREYIGDDAFRQALTTYFKIHLYANTSADDLWKCMADASGKDIVGFMHAWLSQPGFPVLHVREKDGVVILSQERFFVGPHGEDQAFWPIPLGSTCSEMPKLFEDRELTTRRTHQTPLRFNVGDSAHYITHYEDHLLTRLIDQVRDGSLSNPVDRLQLLHEQVLLARGGIVSSAALIPLLSAYRDETSETVWDTIGLAISELKKFVESDTRAESQLKTFTRELARKQYERLGWTKLDDETESDTKLRSTIIGLMMYGEDQDVIKMALGHFDEKPVAEQDAELRELFIAAAVRHGNRQDLIPKLISEYRSTHSSELQLDIASGTTSARKSDDINLLINLLRDHISIRSQDLPRWFALLIKNRYARDAAWHWVRDEWTWIETTYKDGLSYDDFPRYAASALVTRTQLEEYRDFFAALESVPGLKRVIKMGVGEIEGRVGLIERDSEAVHSALRDL